MKKAFITLIALIVLGGAGFAAYHYTRSDADNNSATTSTHSNIDVTQRNAKDTVAYIDTQAAAKYPDLKRNIASRIPFVYDLNGYSYGVIANISYANFDSPSYQTVLTTAVMGQQGSALPASLKDDAVKWLEASGYSSISNPKRVASYLGKSTQVAYFTNDSSICVMTNYTSTSPVTTLNFGCSNMTDIIAAAKAAQPFTDAIAKARSTTVPEISVATPRITTDDTNTYDRALISFAAPTPSSSVGLQAAAYFYKAKTANDDTWRYVAASQEGLSCSQLTAEQQTAFAGICSDTGP